AIEKKRQRAEWVAKQKEDRIREKAEKARLKAERERERERMRTAPIRLPSPPPLSASDRQCIRHPMVSLGAPRPLPRLPLHSASLLAALSVTTPNFQRNVLKMTPGDREAAWQAPNRKSIRELAEEEGQTPRPDVRSNRGTSPSYVSAPMSLVQLLCRHASIGSAETEAEAEGKGEKERERDGEGEGEGDTPMVPTVPAVPTVPTVPSAETTSASTSIPSIPLPPCDPLAVVSRGSALLPSPLAKCWAPPFPVPPAKYQTMMA
ncbi:hypothetical protein KIPB_013183, partial [Kipferlia bialata]